MHEDARARIDNYDIYSIDGDVAVDFVGRYERLDGDLKLALERVGLCLDTELPRAKATFRPNDLPYRDYYDDETPRHRRATGMPAKSTCSIMSFERQVPAA